MEASSSLQQLRFDQIYSRNNFEKLRAIKELAKRKTRFANENQKQNFKVQPH